MSTAKKGSPLTIDDILFATRALMRDDTLVDKIIQEDARTLVLEPDIDNAHIAFRMQYLELSWYYSLKHINNFATAKNSFVEQIRPSIARKSEASP